MTAAAQNLEAIQKAIVQHNGNCGSPILEIRMSPFEVERLGWEEFQAIPIVADEAIGTGRFHLVCEGDHSEPSIRKQVEAKRSEYAERQSSPVPAVTPPVPATA